MGMVGLLCAAVGCPGDDGGADTDTDSVDTAGTTGTGPSTGGPSGSASGQCGVGLEYADHGFGDEFLDHGKYDADRPLDHRRGRHDHR